MQCGVWKGVKCKLSIKCVQTNNDGAWGEYEDGEGGV